MLRELIARCDLRTGDPRYKITHTFHVLCPPHVRTFAPRAGGGGSCLWHLTPTPSPSLRRGPFLLNISGPILFSSPRPSLMISILPLGCQRPRFRKLAKKVSYQPHHLCVVRTWKTHLDFSGGASAFHKQEEREQGLEGESSSIACGHVASCVSLFPSVKWVSVHSKLIRLHLQSKNSTWSTEFITHIGAVVTPATVSTKIR